MRASIRRCSATIARCRGGFPYAIYYRIEGEEIHVWRVLDCRQNPASIAERLKPT